LRCQRGLASRGLLKRGKRWAKKTQIIDVVDFPDDPVKGGQSGHGVIAPLDADGELDRAMLDGWASYRGSGRRHPLTQAVLDAIVERDVRSRP